MAQRHKRINFNARYKGDPSGKPYRKLCAIAHDGAHQLCCCCLVRPSQEIHHSRYRKRGDKAGDNVFPVCKACHIPVCHSSKNWVTYRDAPLWKNHNTPSFEKRLRLGYALLSKGIQHSRRR